jgi:hypothetical protein
MWDFFLEKLCRCLPASGAFFFLLNPAIAQIEIPSVLVVAPPAEISPDLATQQSLFSRYGGQRVLLSREISG